MVKVAVPLAPNLTVETICHGVNEDFLEERLQAIFNNQASLIDMVKLERLEAEYGDFRTKVCFKSGLVLGEYDTYSVMRALEIAPDHEYIVFLLKKQNIANCALHWLYTDGQSLDKLMEIDPIGYFVYAASFVCDNHSPMRSVAQNMHMTKDGLKCQHPDIYKFEMHKWVMQKKALREALYNYPLKQILRINEIMRRYVSMFEAWEISKFDSYEVLCNSSNQNVLEAVGRDIETFEMYLSATIKQIVHHEIKHGRLSYDMDYEDAMILQRRYKGHSNFFAQYEPSYTTISQAKDLLVGFMKQSNVPGEEQATRQAIEDHLKLNKLIPRLEGHTIAKVVTAQSNTTFSFSPKMKAKLEQSNEEIKL